MKVTASEGGNPLRISLRMIGMTVQSHTGKTMPRREAAKSPPMRFLGIKRYNRVSDTNRLITDAIIDPSITKGSASSRILKNRTVRSLSVVCTELLLRQSKMSKKFDFFSMEQL
jgi:hypothetical protein